MLLTRKPAAADPGLYLYRIAYTRPLVESFYRQVTGDEEITRAVLAAADDNEIPLPLAFSLAWVESSFNARAFNRNARSVDRGLFQLNSNTFSFLTLEEFYKPEVNASYGLAHLRFCLDEGGTEVVALAMYNAGTARVRSGTPYSTLNHVARVLQTREQLERDFEDLLADAGRISAGIRAGGGS